VCHANPSVCHLESCRQRFGNLEGSVRSRGARRSPARRGERDLTEAGLNEAAGGWALWDSGKVFSALDVEPRLGRASGKQVVCARNR
jgi:hypothetical protein